MSTTTLSQLVRTTRHLRFSQMTARARRLIRRERTRLAPVPDDVLERVDRSLGRLLATLPPRTHEGAKGMECLDLLEQGLFHHLHRTERIEVVRPNWHLGSIASNRLWVITLHYHQWLYELALLVKHAEPATTERALHILCHYLEDWLAKCDLGHPGADALACNSYAIATRLGWWIPAFELVADKLLDANCDLPRQWVRAMWRQAEHLHTHLEWDLLANHLLRDAVGLAWAARFFRGAQARTWERTATQIALRQAREQVLSDGGHFERSPMYHLEVMQDVRTLATLLRDQGARTRLTETWRRMAECAAWLCHPDGQTAQFNDGSRTRISDASLELGRKHSANRCVPRGLRHLENLGLVAWHGDPWTLFFDVGEIGPDYQPGHAHADTLSVEASFRGKRLFIDPGCHGYDHDDRRRYDRSTAAHNTICIDSQDSSEMWHIFRVGRRARPRDVHVTGTNSILQTRASHTGYDHLRGRPVHTREVVLAANQTLQVRDRVVGKRDHDVRGGWLLEPGWTVVEMSDGWHLRSEVGELRLRVESSHSIELATRRRPLHPDYGIEFETTRLEHACRGSLPVEFILHVEEV